MSISRNTGSVSRYLSRITMSLPYQHFRYTFDKVVDRIPYVNRHLNKAIFRLKRGLKGLFFTNNLFVDLGFEYVGPLNGHDEQELELVLRRVKKLPRPVVVHIVTKKGKGYLPAEKDPATFHGISPFNIKDGSLKNKSTYSFTTAFSKAIVKIGAHHKNVATVTAAMSKGTGLEQFARLYSDRFFDVGIAEEHAVTFAGGLAKGGIIPVVCLYSTFCQRAIDQIIHDVAIPNAHVIFMIDRAGIVPFDGETHQGMFDISLLKPIPNLKILSPATAEDLFICLKWALKADGPVAIRYPKGACKRKLLKFCEPAKDGIGVFYPAEIINTDRILFITTGSMFKEVYDASILLDENHIAADIYSLRFIKPLNEQYLINIVHQYSGIILVEDGVFSGGISEYIEMILFKHGFTNVEIKVLPDVFLKQGSRNDICHDCKMTPIDFYQSAVKLLSNAKKKEHLREVKNERVSAL